VAELLLRSGRRVEASKEVAMALRAFRESGDLAGEALAMNIQGTIHLADGKPDAAAAAHLSAESTACEAGIAEECWRAHAGLAAALGAKGETAAARDEVLRAIDGVERVRSRLMTGELKMRFLARRIDLFELALTLTLTPKKDAVPASAVADGFRLAERARARSLLDLLAESRAQLRARLDSDLVRGEEELLDLVSAAAVTVSEARDESSRERARLELAEAETRLERFAVKVRREAPGYAGLAYPSPASADEIRTGVLRDDEVLLSYFVGDERAWLWVVDRGGFALFPLVAPDTIADRVRGFLEAATAPRVELGADRAESEAAERLAAAILPPVELTPGTRLIVAADGPLHQVPFDALRADGRFLVEDHEVLVVPSATALRLMREQPWAAAVGGFLGVGAPIARADEPATPSLHHARRELDQIFALFPESERRLLAGSSATKTGLEELDLTRFRFVHFATHGWIEADNPRRSGLWLSDRAEDGVEDLLSVDDVLALRLRSEVVVLSACSSGLGELLRGEGLVSLTRSFLYAGSRSVVVTLWDVADSSTTDFMLEVYRGLIEGQTVTASLRRAKLEFLKSERPARRRIRRWAPFVTVGDPGEPAKGLNRAPADPTL
jgi:CHAT domain-containing protein